MRWFRRRKNVLVVGSCHLDVIADFDHENEGLLDKPGTLNFSVGGTAYNIAVNLAYSAIQVDIFSIVKKDSVISDIIQYKLLTAGVKTKNLFKEKSESESGFVAHRETGGLISAVTATLIDRFELDQRSLRDAIRRSDAVVFECNLSEKQICEVAGFCFDLRKPLFANAVSDAKAERLFALSNFHGTPATLLSMNRHEAEKLNINIEEIRSSAIAREATLATLNTRSICITLGKDGLLLFSKDTEIHQIKAPKVIDIVSTSGAGDAVLSSMVESFLYKENTIEKIQQRIHRRVSLVLGTDSANVGGSAKTENFLALRGRKPVIVRLGENTIVFNYLALILGLAGILLTVYFGIFFSNGH